MKGYIFLYSMIYISFPYTRNYKEIMNLKLVLSLLFLNINISVTIYNIDLKCSVCARDIEACLIFSF